MAVAKKTTTARVSMAKEPVEEAVETKTPEAKFRRSLKRMN